MKRISRLNKIIALALACALFLSSPIGVFADNDAPTQESQEGSTYNGGDASNTLNADDAGASDGSSDELQQDSGTAGDEGAGDTENAGSTEDADAIKSEKGSEVSENTEAADDEGAVEAAKSAEGEGTDEQTDDSKVDIEYTYTPNNNSTHIKKWTDENGNEQSEVEPCIFENGVCKYCKYAEKGVSYELYGITNPSAYGFASSDKEYIDCGEIKDSYCDDNHYAVQIYNYVTTGVNPELIAPYSNNNSNNKVFVYNDGDEGSNGKVKFTFTAPENYYIASIRVGNKIKQNGVSDISTIKEYSYESINNTVSEEINLAVIGNDKYINAIALVIKPIPVEFLSEDNTDNTTQVVAGAKIVDYKNNTKDFGDNFYFNNGSGINSNNCHYTLVWQGLGVSELKGDFALSSGNKNELFPTAITDENKAYIDKLYNDVGVVFKKDNDGYWTLDSSQYLYVYEEGKIVPKTGTQFRPFGTTGSGRDHFGMELPIKFSINSDGKTNGKDTVFKFSGDDDVFVYIDGTLVLDLGGIHDVIRGQINFESGDVLIQGGYQNTLTSSVDDTVYANPTEGIKNQNIYKTLDTDLTEFSKGEHTLTVVYFERGGNLSNCKISYNFNKDETVDVEYKGLKLDEDGKSPVEGAEFTLYTDEECKEVAKIGMADAVASSDENGTIQFKNLSLGVLTSSNQTATKTYYMKETQAAANYKTPTGAIWKLTLEASFDGTEKSAKSTLTAVNKAAKDISLFETDKAGNQTVKAITNERKTGSLRIIKDLKTFVKSQGTATFVFEVSYELNGKAHSNVYSYDFNEAGRQNSILIDNLPAGVDVTVKEVYSGACYEPVGDDSQTVTIVADDDKVADDTEAANNTQSNDTTAVDDTQSDDTEAADNTTVTKNTVTFVNDYDGRTNYGGISIKNVFTKLVDEASKIRYEFEKAIMGGKEVSSDE